MENNDKTPIDLQGGKAEDARFTTPMARGIKGYLESASKATGTPVGCLSICLGTTGGGVKADLCANGELVGEVIPKILARIFLAPLSALMPGAGYVATHKAREYIKRLANATGTPVRDTQLVVWANNGEVLTTAILGGIKRKAVPFEEMEAFFDQ